MEGWVGLGRGSNVLESRLYNRTLFQNHGLVYNGVYGEVKPQPDLFISPGNPNPFSCLDNVYMHVLIFLHGVDCSSVSKLIFPIFYASVRREI